MTMMTMFRNLRQKTRRSMAKSSSSHNTRKSMKGEHEAKITFIRNHLTWFKQVVREVDHLIKNEIFHRGDLHHLVEVLDQLLVMDLDCFEPDNFFERCSTKLDSILNNDYAQMVDAIEYMHKYYKTRRETLLERSQSIDLFACISNTDQQLEQLNDDTDELAEIETQMIEVVTVLDKQNKWIQLYTAGLLPTQGENELRSFTQIPEYLLLQPGTDSIESSATSPTLQSSLDCSTTIEMSSERHYPLDTSTSGCVTSGTISTNSVTSSTVPASSQH